MTPAVQEVKTETNGQVKFYVHSVQRINGRAVTVFMALPDKNLLLMFALSNEGKVIIPKVVGARQPLDPSSGQKTDYRVGGKHLFPTLVKFAGAILHQSP